jgi:hypothetical protein
MPARGRRRALNERLRRIGGQRSVQRQTAHARAQRREDLRIGHFCPRDWLPRRENEAARLQPSQRRRPTSTGGGRPKLTTEVDGSLRTAALSSPRTHRGKSARCINSDSIRRRAASVQSRPERCDSEMLLAFLASYRMVASSRAPDEGKGASRRSPGGRRLSNATLSRFRDSGSL